MKKPLPLLAALLLTLPVAALAQAPTLDGIPNFHQVTDRIYRGGQPQSDFPANAENVRHRQRPLMFAEIVAERFPLE